MRGRTCAISIGGVAAGIAASLVFHAVAIIADVTDESAIAMWVVVSTTVFGVGLAVERLLGWKTFLLAIAIGFCIGMIAGAPYHIKVYDRTVNSGRRLGW